MKHVTLILGLYAIGVPFGYMFDQFGVPLAWMIGPLMITAILVGSGFVTATVPTTTRPVGQMVVATFVGAHFSQDAFFALKQTAPVVLGICLFTLVAAILVAQLQTKLFGTDPVSALLSVVPTSPVEAAVLAKEHNVSAPPIVFAQTTRIALVVLIVPLSMFATNAATAPVVMHVPQADASQFGLVVMLAGIAAGVGLFKLLGWTNPYFLGPLLASSVLAVLQLQSYSVPVLVLHGAQLILGTWLGSSFKPDLWRSSKTLIASVLMSSSLLLGLCCALGLALSKITDISLATLVLGAAPGGVSEMALTAGILGLDVAMVTVIHLARIFIIMPLLGRLVARLPAAKD